MAGVVGIIAVARRRIGIAGDWLVRRGPVRTVAVPWRDVARVRGMFLGDQVLVWIAHRSHPLVLDLTMTKARARQQFIGWLRALETWNSRSRVRPKQLEFLEPRPGWFVTRIVLPVVVVVAVLDIAIIWQTWPRRDPRSSAW